MSRCIAVAALSILLAACATAPSGSQGGGTAGTSGGAFLIRDYMETDLPRAVYLAKFELVQDLGASLLYPTTDEQTRQAGPGIHRLPYAPTAFVRAQRERYVSRITGLLNQAPPPISQVSMLVVISDQPLNLDPFLRAPSGLRDLLGPRAYISEILGVERILATLIGDPGAAVTEHRIKTVSLRGSWVIRR